MQKKRVFFWMPKVSCDAQNKSVKATERARILDRYELKIEKNFNTSYFLLSHCCHWHIFRKIQLKLLLFFFIIYAYLLCSFVYLNITQKCKILHPYSRTINYHPSAAQCMPFRNFRLGLTSAAFVRHFPTMLRMCTHIFYFIFLLFIYPYVLYIYYYINVYICIICVVVCFIFNNTKFQHFIF